MLKRFYIFLPALLLVSFISDDHENQTYILWNTERPLIWDDFIDRPDAGSSFDAWTYFGIDYSYSWHYTDNHIQIDLNAFAYFDPNQSWVKKNKLSAELLAHEQLHFDIAELYCRYFQRAVHEFRYTDNVESEVDSIFNSHYTTLLEKQIQYDVETNHFEDKAEQEKWNSIVHDALKETE